MSSLDDIFKKHNKVTYQRLKDKLGIELADSVFQKSPSGCTINKSKTCKNNWTIRKKKLKKVDGDISKNVIQQKVKIITKKADEQISKNVIQKDIIPKKNKNIYKASIYIEPSILNHIIGKQFRNINKISSKYKVSILVSRSSSYLKIIANNMKSLFQVVQYYDYLEISTKNLEFKSIGNFIGKKGKSINELRDKYKSEIIIDQITQKVYIYGSDRNNKLSLKNHIINKYMLPYVNIYN